MFDCHTHILPGIDDGASTLEESKKMLTSLYEQGVTTVCLTPHFYHNDETLAQFLEKRDEAFAQVNSFSQELGITLIPASETYFTDSLFHISDLSPLCLDGKRYLLLEFPYHYDFSRRHMEKIQKLIVNRNVRPVLAHIERYTNLFKKVLLIDELIDMGCFMQVNMSSLYDGFFNRQRILKYIKNGQVHLLGTDCHNMESRPPDFKRSVSFIAQKLGDKYIDNFMQNAAKVTKNH
jgi:protein-tyrosine phosphatase